MPEFPKSVHGLTTPGSVEALREELDYLLPLMREYSDRARDAVAAAERQSVWGFVSLCTFFILVLIDIFFVVHPDVAGALGQSPAVPTVWKYILVIFPVLLLLQIPSLQVYRSSKLLRDMRVQGRILIQLTRRASQLADHAALSGPQRLALETRVADCDYVLYLCDNASSSVLLLIPLSFFRRPKYRQFNWKD